MRVIFFGTPNFAVPSLKALLDAGHDVALVVTQPDRLKGRGHRLSQPAAKEFALLNGIPVIQPLKIRDSSFADGLASYRPDVIAVVAYGRIIPPRVLDLPPLGCINVHGSLLPKYRGAAPIQWALINGEEKTGITTMLMDKGLDTGPMLLQQETEITDDDDAAGLGARLAEMGAALLVRTLAELRDGVLAPRPQSGGESLAPPLTKDNGRIDWTMTAKRIFDLVRGTYPWPGAFCYLAGEKITVIRASVADQEQASAPGRIRNISAGGIAVGAGRGVLLLREIKPEGKKAMPAAAFANGRRLKEGMFFESR